MQKTIIIFFVVFLFISLVNVAYSSPAMRGIAINNETKECAGYWAGDEFVNYVLPSGWKPYYPNSEKYKEGLVIESEYGNCNLALYSEEECCRSLGLTFVSSNIGTSIYTDFGFQTLILPILLFIIIIFLLIVAILVIRRFLKRRK